MRTTASEEWVIPVAKILAGFWTRRNLRKHLHSWVCNHQDELTLPKKLSSWFCECSENDLHNPSLWREVIKGFEQVGRKVLRRKPSLLRQNLKLIAELFDLNGPEQEILELVVLQSRNEPLEDLIDVLHRSRTPFSHTLATITGNNRRLIEDAISPSGRLMRGGLLSVRFHHRTLEANERLVHCIENYNNDTESLALALLGRPCVNEMTWDDFEHLEPGRTLLLQVLKGALEQNHKGINILLYGPPGTGKTTFCQVMAARLERILYSVGESDEEDGEPTSSERLKALRMSQFLLSKQDKAILLVDEMEDVFDHASRLAQQERLSKVHTHRLLENNHTPTLWTCNDIELFGESLLRRFTLAIEIPKPGPSVREIILDRLLAKSPLSLDASSTRSLATEYEMAPALISSAINATCLAKGGEREFRLILSSHEKMINHGQESPTRHAVPGTPFIPELCCADTDLETLATRCLTANSTRFSFCLYGAPGTGKSAYARHLAQRMGLTVIQKRSSDLLDMYVGNSEKRIAKAFAQAAQEKAMLIFDEADSLLSNRRHAQHSWEISQVNEMLTWMESHPYPFVCTTNLMSGMDPASLRRFTFKVRFEPLTGESLRHAFLTYFNLEAPDRLEGLSLITLGDFAVVRNKAEVLGFLNDADVLTDMLEKEIQAWRGHPAQRIGFTTTPTTRR